MNYVLIITLSLIVFIAALYFIHVRAKEREAKWWKRQFRVCQDLRRKIEKENSDLIAQLKQSEANYNRTYQFFKALSDQNVYIRYRRGKDRVSVKQDKLADGMIKDEYGNYFKSHKQ